MALLRLGSSGKRAGVPRVQSLALISAYVCCLVAAPFDAAGPWLMRVIAAARILLLAPLLLVDTTEPGGPAKGATRYDMLDGRAIRKVVVASSLIATISQVYALARDQVSIKEIVKALFSHPAVSSLGCDFVICLVSFALWTSSSR